MPARPSSSSTPTGYCGPSWGGGGQSFRGQRQRLAIARALLRSPAILILDEATSALDPESEAAVQTNLGRIAHRRTTIVISHRLSMVRPADLIIVLDQGRIVGAGRHEALLRTSSLYARMWTQQREGVAG